MKRLPRSRICRFSDSLVINPWDGFAIRGLMVLFYSSLIPVLSAQG